MNRTKQVLEGEYPEPLLHQTGPTAGLRLNFRKAPLQSILNYLHETTDLAIQVEANVEIQRRIDLWEDEPVDKQEAIHLLAQALDEEGYTAIHRPGTLAIIRR